MEKFLSNQDKPLLAHNGFIYTVERTTDSKFIFRCRNRACKGKFIFNTINQPIKRTFFLSIKHVPTSIYPWAGSFPRERVIAMLHNQIKFQQSN